MHIHICNIVYPVNQSIHCFLKSRSVSSQSQSHPPCAFPNTVHDLPYLTICTEAEEIITTTRHSTNDPSVTESFVGWTGRVSSHRIPFHIPQDLRCVVCGGAWNFDPTPEWGPLITFFNNGIYIISSAPSLFSLAGRDQHWCVRRSR